MKRPSKSYMERKTWEEKAKENPLYAVMSQESFLNSGEQPSDEELEMFYRQGSEMVSQWIDPWLRETRTADDMKVLEFGCGMGRLTHSLANSRPSENIYGIDISETMIVHARKNTQRTIRYSTVGEGGVFPHESESFDRVYSYAVFQHIATKSALELSINEIGRVLKSGGKFKLNFEMIFPPSWLSPMSRTTYAFERSYLVYGWKKIIGVPVWGVRRNHSNNWSGIRLGYKQLFKAFNAANLEIYGIAKEPMAGGMFWFLGAKREK